MSEVVSGYQYILTTGVIVPDTGTVLTTVQGEWTGVFGTGLPLQSYTAQGIMISGEVTARSNVLRNNAAIANQINPNQAGGIFLDALAALTNCKRVTAQPSTVPGVTITGSLNLNIPAGTQATEPGGNLFQTVGAINLDPVTGIGTVEFQSVKNGPITAATGTWTIVTEVLGMETITSTNPVQLGTAEQSDTSLKQLRNNTLAIQGKSTNVAVQSAVAALPGVIGTQYRENIQNTTQVIDGITLVANSFWICVDGGIPAQIAMAILTSKGQGANWNGAQSVATVSPTSGQTYNVKYDVPSTVAIVMQINARQGSYVGNPSVDIVAAVLAYAANTVEGFQGFTVGQNASPFDIASAVEEQLPGIRIKSCLISLASTINYQPVELEAALNQKFTINSGSIAVTMVT